ncbi:hypothetical protein EMIT0347P_270001 [Pseudomonas sp. IT-347P]
MTPVISSITDSKGVDIPHNAFTIDRTLKLTGTATSRLKVQVLNDMTPIGTAEVDGGNGKWQLEAKDLSLAVHNFKAKALYGTEPVSAVRTLTVTEATAPTLTSVKGSPSGNDIPQNGFTTETAVTLSGVAAKGLEVELFDGMTTKGRSRANAAGIWEMPVTGLSFGAHSFKAKALYAPGAESDARTLVVAYFHSWDGVSLGIPPTQIPQTYPSGLILTILKNPGHFYPQSAYPTFTTVMLDGGRVALDVTANSAVRFSFGGNILGFVFSINSGGRDGNTFRIFRPNGTAMHSGRIPAGGVPFTYTSSGEPISTVELSGSGENVGWDTGFGITDVYWFTAT